MNNLNEDELTLVDKILSDKNSALWDKVKNNTLTDEDAEQLQQILLDEMYARGMSEGDEPNEYGERIDAVVGKLGFSDQK
jgi:hypothetical protein